MTLHYICRCHSQAIPTQFPWELMYIKGRREKGETLCQTEFLFPDTSSFGKTKRSHCLKLEKFCTGAYLYM